ncbi:MAG: glycerate kinase [Desulfovermiculus sp.]|nr:glycerate kinase [Desulfovermiculus sp.]
MPEQRLKEAATEIFKAGIKAVDPGTCIGKNMHLVNDQLQIQDMTIPLTKTGKLYVVGMGKASAAMAAAVESLLGDRISDGLIITKYGHARPLKRCRVLQAAHPVPDANGIAAAQALIDLVSTADPDDLILCLISGGGSALSPAPVPAINLQDKQTLTRLLLDCGATIHEINTVRKHLSRIKGGQLCRYANKARLISLILSDVIGDDLDIIASGTTVPDSGTFADCMRIVQGYGLEQSLPPPVSDYLVQGCAGQVRETPKPGDPEFDRVSNHIVGCLGDALLAAEEKAQNLGFFSLLLTSTIHGEAREVAKVLASIGQEVGNRHRPLAPPACILSGGETTVTLRGNGLGGRNMELALAAGLELSGMQNTVLLSAGTDGTDGPTDAAGAFASGSTVDRAEKKRISAQEFLARNDSYHFFKQIDELLITGPTGTNVMDIQILLILEHSLRP